MRFRSIILITAAFATILNIIAGKIARNHPSALRGDFFAVNAFPY